MKYLPRITTLALACLYISTPAFAANKSALPPPAPPPIPVKPESSGVFQDSKGASHPWNIGQAHGLRWDGAAYLPVGVAWTPLSWAGDADETAWAKDKAAIDLYGKQGVHDVALSAGMTGLTHVPAASVQRVLDYLDANGFHYGLKIADFPKDPLIGYIVKPAVYRNPSPSDSGPTQFQHIPGLTDAFYLLVSPEDSEIEETGDAKVVGAETAQVTPKKTGTSDILLLYPQRLYLPGTPESRLPDLWQGYDEYRDRLLSFFSHVKLGPGFRFFLNPITGGIGFGGEVENVIPTSDGFRLDFEAWLNKKYKHNVDDLNVGWGIKEHDLPDFRIAARCLPLWSGSKGVLAVYDPEKKAHYAVLDNRRTTDYVWGDLRRFRLESVRGYMNSLADVLKKGVADVPVVYGWGGRSALFTNPETHGGFDGLSIADPSTGTYVFAQAEDTPKTTWLLAAGSGAASQPGLTSSWDALKEIGTRGFFATATTPEEARRLGDYGATLSLQSAELAERLRVLPYPAGIPSLQIGLRRLSDGVWWLPSYHAAASFQADDLLNLGPLLRAYKLPDPDGGLPRFVVWSPHGALPQARFPFMKDSLAVITDAAGTPLKVEKKNDSWIVPLGSDPIIISQTSTVPLPLDAADAADKEATRLLKLAKDQGIPLTTYLDRLFQIRNSIPSTARDADLRYNAFAKLVNDLTQTLQPFVWIEGENAASYTFDTPVSDSEASGGSYLAVDTDRLPPSSNGDGDSGSGYRAEYKFSVNATGSYALWIAASPANVSSPFTYTIDGGSANPAEDAPTSGSLYAGKFLWSQLGNVTLAHGKHTLMIALTGPRDRDRRYTLAIDAFCLSRVPFQPNGTQMPTIEMLPPPVELDKKGKPKKVKSSDKDKDETE